MSIQVFIDWDNDGDFTDAYDDITADVQSVGWSLGSRKAYQAICDEPTCNIAVRNTDGKYTPENSASVIYGKIRPNRRIRIADKLTGAELWNGYLDVSQIDWTPIGPKTGRDMVTLVGVGAKQALERIEVPLGTYEDVTADVIIKDALRKAGIFLPLSRGWFLGVTGYSELGVTTYIIGASAWSTLETGLYVIPFYGDEVRNVWDIIRELTITEQGRFYIDRTGKYIFHNRHHDYVDTDNNTISENVLTDFEYGYGDDIKNSVRVEGKPRKQTASETLWSLDSPVSIAVGDVVEFEARLRRETGQFAGAQSLTATPTFSIGTAIVTVIPRGGLAVIRVDNRTGLMPATLEGLVLVGTATYNQNAVRVNEVDQLSIADVGRQETSVDAGLLGDVLAARDIARMELAQRALRGVVRSVSMRQVWDGIKNKHLYLDNQIGYFVSVQLDSIGHEGRYIIIGEEHRWSVNGNVHEVTFYLEPLYKNPVFRWDVSKWDESYWVY